MIQDKVIPENSKFLSFIDIISQDEKDNSHIPIMWFVDALMEYAELRAAYFTPAMEDMVNDLFLGLSAIALGLVIWVVRFLMKDPEGVVRQTLKKNH